VVGVQNLAAWLISFAQESWFRVRGRLFWEYVSRFSCEAITGGHHGMDSTCFWGSLPELRNQLLRQRQAV